MARRLVADHAVGGVDRLVGEGAGQAGENHPEQRRHHAVGEILGQALDRGPADRSLVEFPRIASDDLRHRQPAGLDAIPLQRRRHRRDMRVEAALRQQAAGQHAAQQQGDDVGKQISQDAGDRQAEAMVIASSRVSVSTPRQRRTSNGSVGEFHALSHHVMSRPIQVTG